MTYFSWHQNRGSCSEMSLAVCPCAGQVVPGVKAARAWSAALARNVRRRASILRPVGVQDPVGCERERAEAETVGTEYRCGVRWRTGP